MISPEIIDELIETHKNDLDRHYIVFGEILSQITADILNPREKSMIFASHATEMPTTFSNEHDKMLYFNNYIKEHNKNACIVVSDKHYDILRANSKLLKTKAPVTNKINDYYDIMDFKYRTMHKDGLHDCISFDYHLHLFMSFTHLLPFVVNAVFMYSELDLSHFNNCKHCLDLQQGNMNECSQMCESATQTKTVSKCPFAGLF